MSFKKPGGLVLHDSYFSVFTSISAFRVDKVDNIGAKQGKNADGARASGASC